MLLVDPDPNTCDRLSVALGERFVLRYVKTLGEAKELLRESVPDVLICEALLGEESGLELCRYVRKTAFLRHIPVMILTSHTALQDKIAGFDAGADDYVVKPFDARHLLARIRLLSRLKRIEQRRRD